MTNKEIDEIADFIISHHSFKSRDDVFEETIRTAFMMGVKETAKIMKKGIKYIRECK